MRTTWSNLGNTPYRQYKQCGNEGGSHTPFIARWPAVIRANSITDQVGHIFDIAPTFLDIFGKTYPDSIHGSTTIPLHGKSLLPIFKGEKRQGPAYFISGMKPFRMFRAGDYKLVKLNFGDWELYHIKNDPTELNNLATVHPEKLKELVDAYHRKMAEFEERSEYQMP